MYHRQHSISAHTIKVRSFALLSCMVGALLVSYVALLGMSVKSVVERKEAETLTATLRAEVATMERDYLVRVSDITEARAAGVGLTKVASKKFAERRVLVGRAQ